MGVRWCSKPVWTWIFQQCFARWGRWMRLPRRRAGAIGTAEWRPGLCASSCPTIAGYPPGVYKQAADVAAVLLNRPGGSPLTILDPLPQRPVFRFRKLIKKSKILVEDGGHGDGGTRSIEGPGPDAVGRLVSVLAMLNRRSTEWFVQASRIRSEADNAAISAWYSFQTLRHPEALYHMAPTTSRSPGYADPAACGHRAFPPD